MQVAGGSRRSKRILLTEQGKMLCRETVDHIIEAEERALGSLSEKEQEDFMNIFARYTGQFRENMQAIPVKRRDGI